MSNKNKGKRLYFEDCNEGDRYLTVKYPVTAEEIIEFANKWDPQPWHIDEQQAKASFFGGLTACSAHIFSIFSIISQQWENGVVQQAFAGLGFDEMRMLKPVYAGDTLQCESVISMVRESKSQPDCGIVTYSTTLFNQNSEAVFSIKASSLMKKNPDRN
ncbi:MaoC/PaaZ C-terminal domain-containing protein [Oceanicoccus sp. KOV_DT_Chl]|uniref:MaoC/PaaZ C-terminal domain-containing protein n=1 Tax=Oceanicoccus sp. KOV_DT_Chl TaxID=1904639 RepID=UPI000C7DC9F4|nr:MaoC/PaaZ C-terminal domain-containing protein [Oceanicoccus sp. KOV_DT_Chl]